MRIQHNVMAMNSYRNYNNNVNALSSNLEKLSSGYRINRAGDDAAGLAISEKMRAQITGLDAAQKNVKDGISLVKTAEGALQEVQDMLNRMVYLAEQSANGTYDNEVDRANLQKEVDSLMAEIDRIADSANFNGQNLLDGSLSASSVPKVFDIGTLTGTASAAAITVTQATAGVYTAALTLTDTTGDDTQTATSTANVSISYMDSEGNTRAVLLEDVVTGGSANDAAAAIAAAINSNSELSQLFSADGTTTAGSVALTAIEKGVASTATTVGAPSITAMTIALDNDDDGDDTLTAALTTTAGTAASADLSGTFAAGDTVTIDDVTYTFKAGSDGKDGHTFGDLASLQTAAGLNGINLDITTNTTVTATTGGKAMTLQIGDTSDSYNQLKVEIKDMHVNSLGLGDIDISVQAGAQAALDKIKEAINDVSSVRGDLGAIQNRLEHTQNNLSVMEENIQDAESTIRDTDIADEMMAYTKNNILIQSAQAMLAQANAVPQGVLQLLQ